jgi:hypothetical protein
MTRVSVDQNLPDVAAYTLPFLFIYNTRGGFTCFLLGVFGRSEAVVFELYPIVVLIACLVLIGPLLIPLFFSLLSLFSPIRSYWCWSASSSSVAFRA